MRRWLLLAATLAATPALGQGVDDKRQTLQSLVAREDALSARIGADRNRLSHLLAALELFSRDPPPPLIVKAEDARQTVDAMILARALAGELQGQARALAAEAAALARLRRQAEIASGGLFEAESEMEDRQGRLDALAGDATLLAPPSVRQAVAAEDAKPPPDDIGAPTASPVAVRYGGHLQSGLVAEGVAYRPRPGAAVVSPAAAVVVYAGPVTGWGEVVILRAGGGCHMVLSGLGRATVVPGQSVAAGAPIGVMPTLGQPPPELYLEVRLARGPIDPARLMSGRTTDVNATGLRLRREGVD